jgi:asparagine synthase (glutamine-hydrolysing)
MCGIVGLIGSAGELGEAGLAVLNETMHSRGPDGCGLHWEGDGGLAMRRLAIIDVEGGDQPVYSEDRQVIVVMNGELYNYRELRAQLVAHGHRFESNGDTEVLVHGYEEWGIDGTLDRIDGMFAFAIWDRRRHRVFLARDRFGEKPLYLARRRGGVVFASCLLTAVAALEHTPPVDNGALQLYWSLHYVPGDRTIFAGVRRVRPGEVYELDAGSGETRRRWRHWVLTERDPQDRSPDQIRELVADAVHSRLVADVPVGVFLSGGLDSSLLAAAAAAERPGIHTFSIGFESPDHDESAYAETVARSIGATHHTSVFGVDQFRDLIPEVVATMDEPIGDQAMLPLFALARIASSTVKVVLSGEGADELFAGYSYYPAPTSPDRAMFSLLRRLRRARSVRHGCLFIDADRTASGFPLVTPPDVRESISPGTVGPRGRWHDELVQALTETRDPLRRATLCDVETWLSEDLLMKADKMTMAHSLESRAPYLAPRLAQAAFSLPATSKIDGLVTKVRLREAAGPLLPVSTLTRPKQGFVLPMDDWLRTDLHDDFIDAVRACREPLIDTDVLERVIRADRTPQGPHVGGRALYPMLVLVRWLDHAQRFVTETRQRLTSASLTSR